MALTVRYKSLSVVNGATQDGLAGCQLEVRLFADGAAATTKLGGAGGTGWKAFNAGEADLGNAEREYASEAENLEFRVFCRRSGTEEKAHVLVASTARAQLLKVRVLQALDLHVPGDTKSIAGTLTINIGDLLARWTNDRWRATPHRVAPPSGGQSQPRLSVVYFTGPHPDTLVERLPSRKCGDGTQPPLYAPITAREHVELKVNAACAAADD